MPRQLHSPKNRLQFTSVPTGHRFNDFHPPPVTLPNLYQAVHCLLRRDQLPLEQTDLGLCLDRDAPRQVQEPAQVRLDQFFEAVIVLSGHSLL